MIGAASVWWSDVRARGGRRTAVHVVACAVSVSILWGAAAVFAEVPTSGAPDDPTPQLGIASIAPAVLTLVTAFLTRNVLLALALGVASGSAVLFAHSGAWEDLNVLKRFLLPALGSTQFAFILLVYLWFLGGVLGVWRRTGAAEHFAQVVGGRIARGPQGAKVFAWLLGCVFHQGGTVSTVLTGTTVRPIADRHRVSHEELAYVVDSTASPIATLAPFSAWPVVIGGVVVGAGLDGFVLIAGADDGVRWFLRSIPYNFYAIAAVLSTLAFSFGRLPWVGRRMKRAIVRARDTGALDAPGAAPLVVTASEEEGRDPDYPVGLVDFLFPLGALLGVAIVPYAWTGRVAVGEAFMAAALVATAVARSKGMSLASVLSAFVNGCRSMTFGAMVVGLAVTLGNVSEELGAAQYVVSAVADALPHWSLPAALTVLCMVASFSVGSSLGTVSVVLPLAIPLALSVAVRTMGLSDLPLESLEDADPERWTQVLAFVQICFGAVMGGAVFGDQCSPISDTTILSSMFTGCDVMDHVRTQLPLALAAAAIAAVCSTVAVLLI